MRAHGIRGTLLLRIDSSAYDALSKGLAVSVVRGKQFRLNTTISSVSPHRTGAAIDLAAVTDRDAAAALVGCELHTERTLLPPPTADEFYACDLIGAVVFSPRGDRLGLLEEIIATGANDVWVIRDSDGELLIPAVAHAVLEVDTKARRIVVDPDAAARA